MLQNRPMEIAGHAFFDPRDGDAARSPFDFDKILAASRRQWAVVALVTLLFISAGVARFTTAVPTYTAQTQLLIDATASRVAQEYSLGTSPTQDDTNTQSQVELIRSERIALRVIDKLHLDSSAGFLIEHPEPWEVAWKAAMDRLVALGWVAEAKPPVVTPAERRRKALTILLDNVTVSRIPRTFVIELGFTHSNPAIASRVANAWAGAYLNNQLEAKYEATKRTSAWLGERIEELRQQSIDADLAVQDFRDTHKLVTTQGYLVTDQRLADLTNQMMTAQKDTSTAQARFQQITAILKSGNMDRAIRESLESPIMNAIRTRYLDALKTYNDLLDRLGPRHTQLVRLASEMEEDKRLMFTELGRIAETLRSDLELAEKREAGLRTAVSTATEESAAMNKALVKLRELERTSETYRNLYQSYLQRYQEATQQQAFPVSEAVVIAEATVPDHPSYPNKRLILLQFGLLGLIVGSGVGAVREYRDRFFRTADQVRTELGIRCLGLAPAVRAARNPAASGEDHKRTLVKQTTVMNHVVDHPFSTLAEVMRVAKSAADIRLDVQSPKVIGIVSCLPGEGKSTISVNFAETLAMQGNRTLLIDGDLRNPGLTRGVARTARAGLVEAVVDKRSLKELVITNPITGLAVLPAVIRSRHVYGSEVFSSPRMTDVLAEAGTDYDYIVIDLPPLSPVVDAAVLAPKIDGFLFVVEWGRTSRRMVRTILATESLVAERCLGVILNKADASRIKYYGEYGSPEYYQSRDRKTYGPTPA